MRLLKNAALAAVFVFGMASQGAEANPVTPFSLTDNGLTVTFTSDPQTDAFIDGNMVSFATLHGNTLIEFFTSGNALTIGFSMPLSSLQLDFALSGSTPDNLNYWAYSGGTGGTLVASGAAPGSPPPFFFNDEGMLSVSALGFDTLVLLPAGPEPFAIDNLLLVTADPPSTHLITFDAPEPLTLALFGTGLVGAAALRRRKKAALQA